VDQPPDYQSLRRLADGVASVVTKADAAMASVVIVVDTDPSLWEASLKMNCICPMTWWWWTE